MAKSLTAVKPVDPPKSLPLEWQVSKGDVVLWRVGQGSTADSTEPALALVTKVGEPIGDAPPKVELAILPDGQHYFNVPEDPVFHCHDPLALNNPGEELDAGTWEHRPETIQTRRRLADLEAAIGILTAPAQSTV